MAQRTCWMGAETRYPTLLRPGTAPCAMIEVQSGEYFGEGGIVGFEDAYGRVTGAV